MIPTLPNTAFKYVFHSKFPAHLLDIDRFAFVNEGGVPSDDEQLGDLRQSGDDFLGQPVAEVFLALIVANVDEWEHGNGGLVREGEGWSFRESSLAQGIRPAFG